MDIGRGQRWAAFNVVGFVGVPVQLGSVWALQQALGLHYLLATGIAIELTLLHNFLWHVHWTWRDRRLPASAWLERFARFNAANGAISLAGNVIVTAVLVEQVHVHYLLANLAGILACALVNFVVSDRLVFVPVLCAVLVWAEGGARVHAAELRVPDAEAFERYARLTEARLDQEVRGAIPFLWIDRIEGARRQGVQTRLRRAEIVVERLETREADRSIHFGDALCHHWVGTVFVPHLGVEAIIGIMQSYDDYQSIYRPAVQRSRTLSRDGNRFTVYLQLFQKKILSVVLNTQSDVTYIPLTPTRVQVRSRSTRIAEVKEPGTAAEQEKPVGRDSGFLWRFNNYCSLESRDQGTYVQCESVSLSRDVPIGLGWLIAPFVSGVPRESLEFTLRSLRDAAGPKGM